MYKGTLTLLLVVALQSLSAGANGAVLDGLHVVDSGSTNAAGWEVDLRSDGSAVVSQPNTPDRTVKLSKNLAKRTFADAAALRNARAIGRSCMKSVSFGTRLTVEWHGWTSQDLSCPSASPQAAALNADVSELASDAQITTEHRFVPIPSEPRRRPPIQGTAARDPERRVP
jgi:hypothetical protein